MNLSDFSDSELSDLPDHNAKNSLTEILKERKNMVEPKIEGESQHGNIICLGNTSEKNKEQREKRNKSENNKEESRKADEQMLAGRVVRLHRKQLPPEQPPKTLFPLLFAITQKQIISSPLQIRSPEVCAQNEPELESENCLPSIEQSLFEVASQSEIDQSEQRFELISQEQIIGRQWALTSQRDQLISEIKHTLYLQKQKPIDIQEIESKLIALESVFEDRGINKKPEYLKFWIPKIRMRNREKYIQFLKILLESISKISSDQQILKIVNDLLQNPTNKKTKKNSLSISEYIPSNQIAIMNQQQISPLHRILEEESSSKFQDSQKEEKQMNHELLKNLQNKENQANQGSSQSENIRNFLLKCLPSHLVEFVFELSDEDLFSVFEKTINDLSKDEAEKYGLKLKNNLKSKKPQILDLTISSDEEADNNINSSMPYLQIKIDQKHQIDKRNQNRNTLDGDENQPKKKYKLNSGRIHQQEAHQLPTPEKTLKMMQQLMSSLHARMKDDRTKK